MASFATILHVSDLHLVEDITEEGERLGRNTRTLLACSHSYTKLLALVNKVYELVRQGRRYDLVLGTGDLSTDGSHQALTTALTFFEKGEIRTGDPSRVIAYGLQAAHDRRLLVPGNHDRYSGRWLPLQRLNKSFETVFKTPTQYPYVRGYRHPDNQTAPTLLFFVFDSTPPPTVKFWQWDRIARGHITKAECLWLEMEAGRIASGTHEVLGLDGKYLRFNVQNCIRIAVMHHHPVVDEAKAESFKCKLTYMENYDVFVDSCFKAGINLVLFGHEHLQYHLMKSPPQTLKSTPFGAPNKLYFLCCPSTLEYSVKKSGFYLIDFDDTIPPTASIELYEWQNRTFNLVSRSSLTM